MALKAFGKMPAGMQPETFIEKIRRKMTGADRIDAALANGQIAQGSQAYGLATSKVSSVARVDAAMAKGQVVLANGNPFGYEQGLHLTGADYGDHGKSRGHHFIMVVGKNPDGSYVVDAPISRKGALTVSGQELAS